MTCNLEIKKGVHSNFIMISPVSTCTFKSRTNRNSVDTLSFLALPCLNGWVSYQEKCYFFSEHTDSWFGASVSIVQLYLHHHHLFLRRNHHHQHNHHFIISFKAFCQAFNSKLAEPKTQEEVDFLSQQTVLQGRTSGFFKAIKLILYIIITSSQIALVKYILL